MVTQTAENPGRTIRPQEFFRWAAACWQTSLLSFRALFNWIAPAQFFLAMVATPIVDLAFYAFLGSNLGMEDSQFFLFGGAILATCLPAIAGGVMALTSERYFGTIDQILISRRSRAYLLLMRAVPYSLAGVVAALFTLGAGMIVLRETTSPGNILVFLLILVFGSLSSTFFGMALGVIGLVTRSVFTLMNIAIMSIALGAGLVVPSRVLPTWLRYITEVFPLKHAGEAIRSYLSNQDAGVIFSGVIGELLVCGVWAAVMFFAFRALENKVRRHGW